MIGRIALMNPKATQTTKMPAPIPIPVFLTIAWLSSVIVSHLGSGMCGSTVSPLYAPTFGWCHVFLLVSVQMPLKLMHDLGDEPSHERRTLEVKVLNPNTFVSYWVLSWGQRNSRQSSYLNKDPKDWEREIFSSMKVIKKMLDPSFRNNSFKFSELTKIMDNLCPMLMLIAL